MAPTDTVTLPARPEPLTVSVSQTAVIVVDMQNAYASPGGLWDEQIPERLLAFNLEWAAAESDEEA